MGNRLSKIYTRTGDKGTTGLGDGSRVDKDDLRVEAYGTVDELNSAVGLVLASKLPAEVAHTLTRTQHELFDLGGELCMPDTVLIPETYVSGLEQDLDHLNADLPPLKDFILPGGSEATARCHLARTICRRAERHLVSLAKVQGVNEVSVRYLNRLSDLLFVAARVIARADGGSEVLWVHGDQRAPQDSEQIQKQEQTQQSEPMPKQASEPQQAANMAAVEALQAAQIYDSFLYPALYGAWTEAIADRAELKAGDKVLDVACGTGALSQAAAARVGPQGSVTGLDIDPAMLTVAKDLAPGLEWRLSDAVDLPFGNGEFNAVVSHFALQYFDNHRNALSEMYRVLHRGGCLVVAVWGEYIDSPAQAALIELIAKSAPADIASALKKPFSLGSRDLLRGAFDGASIFSPQIETLQSQHQFSSIRAWVETELRAWTDLKIEAGDPLFESLLETADSELAGFADENGRVSFNLPAHIAKVVKV
jgi:cob(I)alamin adenosyltransferase